MKVLHVAAGLPTIDRPYQQPFIKSQIDSLIEQGIDCGVFEINGYRSDLEYIKSIKKIRKIVLTENYDLIHSHYSYCGLAAYLAKTGRPLILSLMGSDLLGRPDTRGKITIRGRLDKTISKFISKKVDHIIVKSNNMIVILNTKVPVSIIPNGVDSNLFKPLDVDQTRKLLGFNQNDFIVLFLGNRNQPVKNFNLAKESFDLFKATIKNDSVIFVNPFGIDKNSVIKFMSAANVLLLTSFWEGSPNVVKEAMACNLPIISTDVGDVKEIVKGTEYCFITGHSEDEIATKLKIIYEKKERSNGRKNIEHLRDDLIAKKIIKIYENV